MFAYVLQMASFTLLRRKVPSMARPFTSRLGIPGALILSPEEKFALALALEGAGEYARLAQDGADEEECTL